MPVREGFSPVGDGVYDGEGVVDMEMEGEGEALGDSEGVTLLVEVIDPPPIDPVGEREAVVHTVGVLVPPPLPKDVPVTLTDTSGVGVPVPLGVVEGQGMVLSLLLGVAESPGDPVAPPPTPP